MIDSRERLYFLMLREPFSRVRTAFIQRSRVENDRIEDARLWMEEQGFEVVEVAASATLTADGREVSRAFGKSWALTLNEHVTRREAAINDAVTRKKPHVNDSEQTCLALIEDQLCGGSLTMSPVCPKCALGKSGVAATLTCDVCGHVTAIMRGGS